MTIILGKCDEIKILKTRHREENFYPSTNESKTGKDMLPVT